MCGSWFCMSDLLEMGCCGCFGFLRKPSKLQNPYMIPDSSSNLGDNLLDDSMCFDNGSFYNNGGDSDFLADADENGVQRPTIRRSEEVLQQWAESGLICRQVPVKETHTATLSEVHIYIIEIPSFLGPVWQMHGIVKKWKMEEASIPYYPFLCSTCLE